MARTYRIKLWKNYGVISALALILFVFGIGLAMYLIGIAFLIAGVASFLGFSPDLLATSSGYMGLFIGLLFSYSGHVCLWGFFAAYKTNISFTEKEIILRTPRKTFFFLYKEQVVSYSDIKGIFFGYSIMERVYPEDLKNVPAQYWHKQRNSGLEVYFQKNGKEHMIDMPIFKRYPEYYEELRKFITNNGMWQTEAKCLFVKDNSFHPKVVNVAPVQKKGNKIIDIMKILLVFVITGAFAYLGYYLGMRGIL